MTSARTASRQSLEGVPAATDIAGDAGRTGNREKEDKQTGHKRGRGSTTGDSKSSNKAVVSDKLKLLDMLLSDDIDRPLPEEKGQENNDEEARASSESEEGDDTRAGGNDVEVEHHLRISPMEITPSTTMAKKTGARRCQEPRVPVLGPEQTLTVTDIHGPHGGRAGGGAEFNEKEADGTAVLEESVLAKEGTNLVEKALPNHR